MTKKSAKPVTDGGKKVAKGQGKKGSAKGLGRKDVAKGQGKNETAKDVERTLAQTNGANGKAAKSSKADRRAAKRKAEKQSALREELKDLTGVEARKDVVRLTAAVVCLIVTVFLIIALVSNIFTGAQDQAKVIEGGVFEASNKAGYLGAVASYFLMHQLFGFGSLIIPVFLASAVLKLMLRDDCPLRVWIVFIHCVIIAFLVSVDATYIQNNLLPSEWCNLFGFELGGMHGHDIVGTFEGFLGSTITFVLLLLLTVGYIGYWFTQVFIWIAKGVRKLRKILPPDLDGKKGTDPVPDGEKDEDKKTEPTGDDGTANPPTKAEVPGEDGQKFGGGFGPDIIDIRDDSSPNEEIPSLDAADPLVAEPQLPAGTICMVSSSMTAANGAVADTAVGVGGATGEGATGDPEELIVNDTVVDEKADGNTVESVDEEMMPFDPKADLERYQYPPISLLEQHASSSAPTTREELEENKNRIIDVLRNFGVEISKISATVGPTVTLYEITPAPGVRIAKIRNLEDDIALSLSALGIRIIAPIPGKGTIGIEVPNKHPQVVSMESIVNTQKFKDTKYELPIALGKTITNEIFMVDLAKMPHLLVAGATGQGKSVGLNAIITSLLYKKHPSELKIVMIDPKKVEFSMYNPIINHFLAQVPDSDEPVVTDVKKVINTLKSLCEEMDNRYDLLKNAHCRNIKEYNAKFCERKLPPDPMDPFGPKSNKFLPYIVVIIDEFGDLIMTAGKEIELPIARIAQLARAVGIHMVIATQSPRATIITGKIKANFPARMAFRVSQGIESQTILDRRGANNLIGKGDMLFQAGSELTRVQCAFVDTPEVVAIAKYISEQQSFGAPFELPLVADDGGDGTEGVCSQNGESTFEQVARFVVNTQQGSTSKIQRTFSVGFNRAGRLMDQLEEAGIVGPQMGSRPREVLVQSEVELRRILDAMREAGQSFD